MKAIAPMSLETNTPVGASGPRSASPSGTSPRRPTANAPEPGVQAYTGSGGTPALRSASA